MRHNVSPKSWWKHFICRCTFRVRPYQYFYSTFKLKNRETKLTLNNSKTYLKTNPCLASVLKIVFQRSCVTAVVEMDFFTSNLGLRKSDLYAGNTVYVSYRGNPRIPLIRYNSRIDTPKDFGKITILASTPLPRSDSEWLHKKTTLCDWLPKTLARGRDRRFSEEKY